MAAGALESSACLRASLRRRATSDDDERRSALSLCRCSLMHAVSGRRTCYAVSWSKRRAAAHPVRERASHSQERQERKGMTTTTKTQTVSIEGQLSACEAGNMLRLHCISGHSRNLLSRSDSLPSFFLSLSLSLPSLSRDTEAAAIQAAGIQSSVMHSKPLGKRSRAASSLLKDRTCMQFSFCTRTRTRTAELFPALAPSTRGVRRVQSPE